MSEPSGPRVALTFDAEHPDRPGCPPGTVDRILSVLRDRSVRASFFLQGRWVESQPETAREIALEGHLIGNHGFYHARMPLLSSAGVISDVSDAHEVIAATTGVDPTPWFRFPFGAGHDDPSLLATLAGLGYRNVHWTLELEDWEPQRSGRTIAADAAEGVRHHGDGAVILLHTWPAGTGDAVGPMIDAMRGMDVSFATVDQLEALP